MQRITQGRHLADKQKSATKSRTAHFMRLSRTPRETFHAHHSAPKASRLMQFLRIARGELA